MISYLDAVRRRVGKNKRPVSVMTAALSSCLCVGLFFTQTVFPLLHLSDVVARETLAHKDDAAPAPGEISIGKENSSSRNHSHHDADRCPVEKILLQGRWVAAENHSFFNYFFAVVDRVFSSASFLEPESLKISGSSPRSPPL